MPERMQAECQCGIRTESHTIALLSARYWRRNGEESPRLPALRWPGSTSVVVFGQGRRSGRTPPPSAVCQDWRLAGLEQLFIGSDQSQPKHPRRGHQKPVGGIAVRQLHASRFLRDLVGDRRAWEPHPAHWRSTTADSDAMSACFSGKGSGSPTRRWAKATTRSADSPAWQ